MSSVPLQKPTEDMTLREIREYVSPHRDPEMRDWDHAMIRLDLAKVLADLQDTPVKPESLANIGEKLDDLESAVEFADDFFQELKAVASGIREEEHETFNQAAKEIESLIDESNLHEWLEDKKKESTAKK